MKRKTPTNILMVVPNPSVDPRLGSKLGFWAAELTHPYCEFCAAGYRVTIASPDGGPVAMDPLSDPRDPSPWSEGDLLSLGFINMPAAERLLEKTPQLATLRYEEYDALVVCGGQSAMYTFRGNVDLHQAIRTFYEAGKVIAVLCRGLAALLEVRLSDGSHLVEGKTVTGLSNSEEAFADEFAGRQVMPWSVEDALRDRGANYIMGGRFKAFAVRDGNLITGQQQYSARKVAEMVIAALGV